MRLRQLVTRALSLQPLCAPGAMRASLPPACALFAPPACRAPAVAAAAGVPRHAAARLLAASSFCPGSRALLHASARAFAAPQPARTVVAPRGPRAQAATFRETGLDAELLSATEALGLKAPTEIQAQAIPEIISGGHVVLASHTGSGKTLAFLLPLVHGIRAQEAATGERVRPKRPRAVILEPTRELAQQVLGVCKSVCHHARFSSALISGGGAEKMQTQREVLAAPRDVLVGTPGRLLQLLREGAWYAGDVRCLVVDEADTLLDKGFGPEVEALLAPVLATGGQAVLVSATLTKPLQALLDARLPDARRVATASLHRAVAGARHRFLPVPGDGDKLDTLRTLLAAEEAAGRGGARTMVFCNTLPSCRAVEHALAEAGLATVSYHGDMASDARTDAVRAFTAQPEALDGIAPPAPPVMVCTDLAARGLDFGCGVGHVVMFDFPLNPVDYLHRTGRTARAGASGRITSLVTKRDRVLAEQIEDGIRSGAALDALSSSKSAVEAQKRAVAAAKAPPRRPSAGPPGRRSGAGAANARGTRGAARGAANGAPSKSFGAKKRAPAKAKAGAR